MASNEERKDHWSSKSYTAAASFVPALTTKVQTLLSPSSNDKILDIGCGDGVLTNRIATQLNSGSILGLDFSANMIKSASEAAPGNASYRVADCSALSSAAPEVLDGSFDKVFSNAAFHWILGPSTKSEEARRNVFIDAFKALKPGGSLVFECGGAGNVAEVHGALIGSLVHCGFSFEQAKAASPWFFASETWMRDALTAAGFEVEVLETEYRPTRLERGEGGGLEGWVRLMGAQFLEKLEEGKREGAVNFVCGVLESVCGRSEGDEFIGYVRLRGAARKPAS